MQNWAIMIFMEILKIPQKADNDQIRKSRRDSIEKEGAVEAETDNLSARSKPPELDGGLVRRRRWPKLGQKPSG